MLSSYTTPSSSFSAVPATAAAPSPVTSTHYVGESARAVCFLKDATRGGAAESDDASSSLPLVAVGGENTLALYLPVVASSDEQALRDELASNGTTMRNKSYGARGVELTSVATVAHDGDVTALQFAGGRGNLLVSASSIGTIHAWRVGGSQDHVLASLAVPQWQSLFGGASATALDVSADRATLVAASASGAVAWLRFDDDAAFSAQVVRNGDSSRLPLHGVKMLARESVVATVGAAPGAQLRVWDINANSDCPVAVAADPHATCALTALETHPTRPELLITGSDDGRVALWDLRRLDAPFRVESRHTRAVRTLAIHETSPRLLFSGSDDATVLAWDFHHNRPTSEAVEYERHVHSHRHGAGLAVQPLATGFLPWRAMDFHAASDTLLASSDAQSLLLVRHASRAHHALSL